MVDQELRAVRAFTPRILQDVDLERKMIHAVAAGLGVAIVPEQLKRLEHENVVFPAAPTRDYDGRLCCLEEPYSVACVAGLYPDGGTGREQHPLRKSAV